MWTLPVYQDLTPDQRSVIDLPLDQSHLVTGPPGSGKTVMAVYRAQALQKRGEPTMLIMYSKLLSTYTKDALESLGVEEGSTSTMHAWFHKWFKRVYGDEPPTIDKFTFDWDACLEIVGRNPAPEKLRQHVIIDEGQDLPKRLYQLLRFTTRSITVFADENQSIWDENATNDEIAAAAGIRQRAQLLRNFRNTRAIGRVSAHFYTGAGSPPVEMRESAEDGDLPVLDEYDSVKSSVDFIVNFERSHPADQIGVLVQYNATMKKLLNRLKDKTVRPVEVYSSDEAIQAKGTPVDFSRPGIKIINWASAKGLEFDSVLLPELQTFRGDASNDNFRMRMYMLTSRARRELYFQYSGTGEPAVIKTLPMEHIDDWR